MSEIKLTWLDYVRHQPIEKEKPWDPGTVKQVLNDRSYIVSTDAGVILS